jgi:predicted DNA-binding transcriptional regulator AlpA
MKLGNIEKFKIISKQWATVKDVIALTGFGKSKSYQIITEIQTQILDEGKRNIARGVVPMERVIAYLDLSRKQIYQIALQEKQLFGLEGQA